MLLSWEFYSSQRSYSRQSYRSSPEQDGMKFLPLLPRECDPPSFTGKPTRNADMVTAIVLCWLSLLGILELANVSFHVDLKAMESRITRINAFLSLDRSFNSK